MFFIKLGLKVALQASPPAPLQKERGARSDRSNLGAVKILSSPCMSFFINSAKNLNQYQ